MKILSCYIENFGKFKQQKFTFSDGLNVFCRENGWGKSTLAAFLKTMLYGFPETKKTDLDENERKRYLPWDDSPCGGYLIYETEAGRFRVERTFGKIASKDGPVRIFDEQTGAPMPAPAVPLGETLFGIDADGFARTVYLSEHPPVQANANPSVTAKLADLAVSDDDIGQLDTALRSLDKERQFWRKANNTGELPRLEGQLLQVERDIECAVRDAARLAEAERQLTAAQTRIQELDAQTEALQNELSGNDAERRLREQEIRVAEAQIRRDAVLAEKVRAEAFFHGRIPNEEEIREAEYRDRRASELRRSDLLQAVAGKTSADLLREQKEARTLAGRRKRLAMFLLALALVPLCVGLFLLLQHHRAAYAALGAFFVTFGMGFSLLLRAKRQLPAGEETLAALREAEEAEAAVRAFLQPFGLRRAEDAAASEKETVPAPACGQDPASPSAPSSPTALSAFETLREHLQTYRLRADALAQRAGDLLNEEKARDLLRAELYAGGFAEKGSALDACRSERDALFRRQSDWEREIAACRHTVGQTEILQAQREELRRRKADVERKFNTLKYTADALSKAKTSLNARYLGSTTDAFRRYLTLFAEEAPETAEAASLDTSFAVSRLDGGKTQPGEAYSRGTRDLFAFASRIALVDALYEKESPFLIFDDPFAAWDDAKISRGIAFLRTLSATRQIFYFTCSASRSGTDL